MIDRLQVDPTYSSSYNVLFDSSLDFSHIWHYIADKQVLIITSATVEKLYLNKLFESIKNVTNFIQICILEDGEQHKSQQSLDKIINTLLTYKFARLSTTIIALGGGVVGDIAGFAAAIYQRGVDLIQIPTTLLSQVDSSVGGKTAINHSLAKNMIGAFYQPTLVYTSIKFCKSLSEQEYISGMAEVIKYGFISRDFAGWLKLNRQKILQKNTITLIEMIKKSCQIKAQVVAQDEKDLIGERMILNFGHTFGHAIEKCQNYQGLKHGEAVGIGMAQAIDFSYFLGMINEEQAKLAKEFIISFGILITFPKDINKQEYLDSIMIDKKNSNTSLQFILMDKLENLVAVVKPKQELEKFLDL